MPSRQDAAAAARIRLLHVHRAGLQHLADVVQVPGIFAGRDLDLGRHAITQQVQAFKVVARHRLLEPPHALGDAVLGHFKSALARQGAVNIGVGQVALVQELADQLGHHPIILFAA